jgi:hypothetical protein
MAAIVIKALTNPERQYYTSRLAYELEDDSDGRFNLTLTFRDDFVPGIELVKRLDKALRDAAKIPEIYFEWDNDLIIFKQAEGVYSVRNFSADPSLAADPIVLQMAHVKQKDWVIVLTHLLDGLQDWIPEQNLSQFIGHYEPPVPDEADIEAAKQAELA